jgi:predicted outer membrane repeat protein
VAFLEIKREGSLVRKQHVDDSAAQKGICFQLGSERKIHMSLGQTKHIGLYTIRLVSKEEDLLPLQNEAATSSGHFGFSRDQTCAQTPTLEMPSDVQGYHVFECLGRGGMGSVWRAEQLSVKREVALKFMTQSYSHSNESQIRFKREVELTASLDHPNIAKLYDSGLCGGRYYYAMELIHGVALDRYVRTNRLSSESILRLMIQICEAVQCAHQKGVIHRDLKPSNILVDKEGQPHILDFGLAKTFWGLKCDKTVSVQGAVIGTPAYMAPEQAAGRHEQMDTRSDVFSLGVILYSLLLGQTPHDTSGTMLDLLQRIGQGQIRKPREVDASLPLDLEAVILKSLSLDMDQRYLSAGDMADDLRDYLSGEPVRARVPTRFYMLRKKARKYRLQISMGLALLFVTFGMVLFAYTKIIGEKTRRQIAEEQAEIQNQELAFTSEKLTWTELRLKILGKNKLEAQAALNLIQEAYTTAQNKVSQLNYKLGTKKPPVPPRRMDLESGSPLRSTSLVRRPGAAMSWTLETHAHRGPVHKLMYSPEGKQLASIDNSGAVRIWDAESGRLNRIFLEPNDVSHPSWLTSGPDPGRVWIAGDDLTQSMQDIMALWTLDLPDVWQSLQRTVTTMALSPDHAMLALGYRDGTIRVLNPWSGKLLHTSTPVWCGPVYSVEFSSNGKVLATGGGSGTIGLWDAHSWQPLRKFRADCISDKIPSAVITGAWGFGDNFLTRVNNDQDGLDILDARTGQVLRVLHGNRQKIATVSWAPHSTRVAAGTLDGAVHVWDIESDINEPLLTFSAHNGCVNVLAWKPEGQGLITCGQDGKIAIWDARTGDLIMRLEPHTDPISSLAISPDGKVLASGGGRGYIHLWDLDAGKVSNIFRHEPNDMRAGESGFTALAWSPDGRRLASARTSGTILIWDSNARQPLRSFAGHCGMISSITWSPDGRVIVYGGKDGTVRVRDVGCDFGEHVVLLPLWDSGGAGIAIGSTGDYRGSVEVVDQLVYLVKTENTLMTLTAADFRSQYGWINEPWQVGLFTPGVEKVERLYVNAASEDPCDGKTWATSFRDLQEALSIAKTDTEIWVAAGTYTPDRGTQSRTASFYLKNGVRLLGGFVGTETSVYQRDPNRHETILSGDLKGNDEPGFVNTEENSFHVIVSNSTDPNTLLDGFTITSGNANGMEEGGNRSGGGMRGLEANLTLMNCIFRHNSALKFGGGVGMIACDHSTLVHCQFINNVAGEGGGVGIAGSNPVLMDCQFIDNRAIGRIVAGHIDVDACGGGVSNNHGMSRLNNCTFTNNKATHGGAIYNSQQTRSILTHCQFIGNSADDGGAIVNDESNEAIYVDCTFIKNVAHSGGGMYNNRWSAPTITNCQFFGNTANNGGGVCNGRACMAVLRNCTFSGNRAKNGGGMFIEDRWEHPDPNILLYRDSQLVNCTLSMNDAAEYGGGIWNSKECNPKLINCVLWGNSDNTGTGELAQIYGVRNARVSDIEHSCIQGWTGQFGGTACFGEDPLFIDADGPDNQIGTDDDDLHLQPGSPCVDAGNNRVLPLDTFDLDKDGDANGLLPFDLGSNPRILNGTVDMGAYESN